MRLANLSGRAALVVGEGAIDLADASGGRFAADLPSVYDQWEDVSAFAAGLDPSEATAFDERDLLAPSPQPRQVLAIGMNYKAHAAEAGLPLPPIPAVFAKYATCLTGPFADVALPSEHVDWEVELVVVIGRHAHRVSEALAWEHVAGVTVGQDLSDRIVQFSAGGQFSLGKSYPGFGPMGPFVVTVDELDDPDDLALGCAIDGETVQNARTDDMVFAVPELIARISAIMPLLPGDVIFTGTPSGIGATRTPPRFLRAGETLETWIDGIGTMRNRMIEPAS